LILDGVAAVSMTAVAVTLLWWLLSGRLGLPPIEAVGGARDVPAGTAENVENLRLRVTPVTDQGELPASAKVAIVEFADFECPFCGKYAHDTLPRLRAEFVETRKAVYVFKHFPLDLHRQARGAAQMAACAGAQGKFWQMHELLFGSPRNLAQDALTGYARRLQLDDQQLRTCLGQIAARIDRDTDEGRQLGVSATPTFLLGNIEKDGTIAVKRRIAGANGYETFRNAIQQLLDTAPVQATH
jgi:protein-disulfide isomerase